jgi:hypothetical protein
MTEWHFKSRPSIRGEFCLAWCAPTPNLGDGPLDVDRAIDCHFEFGRTEEEALARLREAVKNILP